ncbi:MAG TPA: hypothetical protein VF475_13695 [Sphingobium sp.]
MTAQARFRQADVTRAMKAAKRAGYPAVRIEIDRAGKITILASGEDAALPAPAANPWDEVYDQ